MSGGVAGGPSLWTRHRREGGLPWEWLGEYPLCLKLCRVWEPSQVQTTKTSNVTYIIRISSLEW